MNVSNSCTARKIACCVIEIKIAQLVDRVVATHSSILVTTYERQIKELEEKRILTDERIQNCGRIDGSYGSINRTFLEFLQNPHEYWASADLEGKRTVLKVTFARPLAYSKKEGFRTPALSLPFSVLRDFSDLKSGLVVPRGLATNLKAIQFIEAMHEIEKFFEAAPSLNGKSFRLEPIAA